MLLQEALAEHRHARDELVLHGAVGDAVVCCSHVLGSGQLCPFSLRRHTWETVLPHQGFRGNLGRG